MLLNRDAGKFLPILTPSVKLLEKNQRLVAFYILYEAYHHEQNVKTTPFEAVVYSALQACATEI